MASVVALAYNGDPGAKPPVGSRGFAPGRGVRGGFAPLKLTKFMQMRRTFSYET